MGDAANIYRIPPYGNIKYQYGNSHIVIPPDPIELCPEGHNANNSTKTDDLWKLKIKL
jgi:hypothetical protein